MARKAIVSAVAGVLLATLLASGCSSGKAKWWRADRRDRGLEPEKPSAAETAPATKYDETLPVDQQTALAKIEAFLASTHEYELSGMAPPAAVAPSDVAPATADSALPATAEPRVSVSGDQPLATQTPASDMPVIANAQVSISDTNPPRLAVPVVRVVSIRATDKPRNALPPSAEPSGTVNESLKITGQRSALTIDRIIEHFEDQVEQHRDFDSEWRLRLVQLAFDREFSSLESGAHLSSDARRIMRAVFDAERSIRAVARDALLPGNEALTLVDELRGVLADRADPIVSSVALCRKVAAFGVYDELPDDSFVAGRAIQAIAYSELRNLRSERTSDHRFRTLLRTRLEVLTAGGTSVWQHESAEIEDVCRRRRTDFFVAQRLTLPATLAAGDYVLKVYVEDKLSGRGTEVAHQFRIRAADGAVGRGGLFGAS